MTHGHTGVTHWMDVTLSTVVTHPDFNSIFCCLKGKTLAIFLFTVECVNVLSTSGFPLLPVLIYALLRIIDSDKDCWAMPTDPSEWVLNVPSLLSLLVSMNSSFRVCTFVHIYKHNSNSHFFSSSTCSFRILRWHVISWASLRLMTYYTVFSKIRSTSLREL